MVECQLPKLNVAGSIPVSRSSFLISENSTSFLIGLVAHARLGLSLGVSYDREQRAMVQTVPQSDHPTPGITSCGPFQRTKIR